MTRYQEADVKDKLVPGSTPRHVAIIMDGNGRWAKQRGLPRFAGHKAGVEAVRRVVGACADQGVQVLTLFAFSSENWKRPPTEVSLLMELFFTVLKHEVKKLHRNNVRLRIIGGREAFSERLQARIREAEEFTSGNTGLTVVVAANYGGRWDMTQATRKIAEKVRRGELAVGDVTEDILRAHTEMGDLPEPDLFVRTGGEQRISNFLLWHLAYTELYFTEVLWPDFDSAQLALAIESFGRRQRRFGCTGEQVETVAGA